MWGAWVGSTDHQAEVQRRSMPARERMWPRPQEVCANSTYLPVVLLWSPYFVVCTHTHTHSGTHAHRVRSKSYCPRAVQTERDMVTVYVVKTNSNKQHKQTKRPKTISCPLCFIDIFKVFRVGLVTNLRHLPQNKDFQGQNYSHM